MTGRILIWGYGKLGSSIFQALDKANIPVSALIRSSEKVLDEEKSNANTVFRSDLPIISPNIMVDRLSSAELGAYLLPEDTVFVTLPDRLIVNAIESHQSDGVCFIHCSGATPIVQLNKGASGVFYPFQTFSGKTPVDWSTIPIFIESEDEKVLQKLEWIAQILGVKSIQVMNSANRQYLHLVGVFANNFTQTMAIISRNLLIDAQMDQQWVVPILEKTALHLTDKNPWDSLTGPARRGDSDTMAKHNVLLGSKADLLGIYNALSSYISKHIPDSEKQ